jgi:ATP-dependent Clp protease protease subunit
MALQTDLTDLFEYGIDLKNRRIYFGCTADDSDTATDVNSVTIEYAIRAIHRMMIENPSKPIELHVNSVGGNPYDALRLHDEILSCSAQVKFYGGGSIMSSATWIMCACDERYLYQNTTVMCHDGSEGYEGKHTDMQIDAAEAKRLQDLLYDLYEKNSTMSKEFWMDACTRDLYLTAHEAVSLGLADKIVEPKKRGNLRKMRQASLKKASASSELPQLIKDLYSRVKIPQSTTVTINKAKPEPVDPHIIIDDRPVETKEPQQPLVAEVPKDSESK